MMLTEGVYLHLHKETKFKENVTAITLLRQDNTCDNERLWVLRNLLSETCREYPTKTAVEEKMNAMYGCAYDVSVDMLGATKSLSFSMSCAKKQYVYEDLLHEQLRLLAGFLLAPKDFSLGLEEARQKALTSLAIAEDDPYTSVMNEACQLLGGKLKEKSTFQKQKLQDITLQDMQEEYTAWIRESEVHIFLLTEEDVDEEEVYSLFPFKERKPLSDFLYPLTFMDYKEKTKKTDDEQSALVLLYTHTMTYEEEDMVPLMIMNGILGALPSSLLFQEVREKKGLCYSISSENLVYDGCIRIYAGCESRSLREVSSLSKAMLKRIQEGDFSEDLLAMTIRMYRNSWIASKDDAGSLINDDLKQVLLHGNADIDTVVERFAHITKEDVMRVSRRLTLSVEYARKGAA